MSTKIWRRDKNEKRLHRRRKVRLVEVQKEMKDPVLEYIDFRKDVDRRTLKAA